MAMGVMNPRTVALVVAVEMARNPDGCRYGLVLNHGAVASHNCPLWRQRTEEVEGLFGADASREDFISLFAIDGVRSEQTSITAAIAFTAYNGNGLTEERRLEGELG